MKNVAMETVKNVAAAILDAEVVVAKQEANEIHFAPANETIKSQLLVWDGETAMIMEPFSTEDTVKDITNDFKQVLAGIVEAEAASGDMALEKLAELHYMMGHANFAGVELPMQEVMSKIITATLVKDGYTEEDLNKLKMGASSIGEDSHIMPDDMANDFLKQEVFAINPNVVFEDSEEISNIWSAPIIRNNPDDILF